MRSSTAAVLAGASASLILLSSCSAASNGVSESSIEIALTTDPGSLNPITNATRDAVQLAYTSYEPLMYFEAGAEPEGWLAESWTESPTEVTFVLKEGVTCSDGTPLTASDVKNTFEYAADDETGSPLKGVYFPASGLTVDADDETREVTFVSEEPQSFLLQNIGYVPIVCAAGLADPQMLETSTLGTGMYELTESTPGQSYEYTLREDYDWGPSNITAATDRIPQTIVHQVVSSAETQTNMLLSSELQIAEIGGAERERLDDADLVELDVPARPGQIFFNQAEGRATHDHDVRLSIASAIEREDVAQIATSNRGTVKNNLTSSLSSVCIGADSEAAVPVHDVDRAAELLDGAGWNEEVNGIRAKEGEPLSLNVVFPADEGPGVNAAIELLQQQLAEVGIEAVPSPASSYTDVIFQGGDWDLVWAPISASLPSVWFGILSGAFPPEGGNWTYNTNQEYFDLAAEASSHAGEDSCDYWMAAQDSLFSNLEVLPISESTSTFYGESVEFGVSTNGVLLVPTLRLTQ